MLILNKLMSIITKKKTNPKTAKVQEFMAKINMTFNGYGGLCMHSLVVSDFGYLIRYLTEGKIDSFSDFRAITENKELIEKSIKRELSKEILRESEAFGYSREISEGNILRLQKIVNSIYEYTTLCDELEVDIYHAR